MAYCGPRGIPYTCWLGGGGRWDDLSRAAALAWAEREADLCPGCGLHHRDLAATGGDRRKLPVAGEYRLCIGCEAKELVKAPEGDKRRAFHFRWAPRVLRPKAASRGRS